MHISTTMRLPARAVRISMIFSDDHAAGNGETVGIEIKKGFIKPPVLAIFAEELKAAKDYRSAFDAIEEPS
jgi:hypothetical protein